MDKMKEETAKVGIEIAKNLVLNKLLNQGLKEGGKVLKEGLTETVKASTGTALAKLADSGLKTGIIGGIGGNLAIEGAKKVIPALPGAAKQMVETLGYGGYERGLAIGFQQGASSAISTLKNKIKEMGPFELMATLNGIIALNPPLNMIKNTVVVCTTVGGTCLLTYKSIEYASYTLATRAGILALIKRSQDEILSYLKILFELNKLSPEQYNKYVEEVFTKFNPSAFSNLKDILLQIREYYKNLKSIFK